MEPLSGHGDDPFVLSHENTEIHVWNRTVWQKRPGVVKRQRPCRDDPSDLTGPMLVTMVVRARYAGTVPPAAGSHLANRKSMLNPSGGPGGPDVDELLSVLSDDRDSPAFREPPVPSIQSRLHLGIAHEACLSEGCPLPTRCCQRGWTSEVGSLQPCPISSKSGIGFSMPASLQRSSQVCECYQYAPGSRIDRIRENAFSLVSYRPGRPAGSLPVRSRGQP